jgi:uncharacterized protein (TIGR03083 family)
VEPLGTAQLEQRSYASEWSIAQVLSHIGSGSEIFGLFLDAGLSGASAPGADVFAPIWERWNAKSPKEQATDALASDGALLARFESLDEAQLERVHLEMWGTVRDVAELAKMRLSEHAMHTWDIAVALDPTATVTPDAIDLLVDMLEPLAGRYKPDGNERQLKVTTTAPQRQFTIETGEAVALRPFEPGDYPAELDIPAEAFVRGVELDELRAVFVGF